MQKIAMIGLGAMGLHLALNIKDKGIPIIGYNRSAPKRQEAAKQGLQVANSLDELKTFFGFEKKILWLMVSAKGVDAVLKDIAPLLKKGDIIVEGGNSHYLDTERRVKWAQQHGIHYLGTGVSGGEAGARYGPALMPGGSREGYQALENVFFKIAAKAPQDNKPCVSYVGPGGAGHFVKIVHNGIEYAIMGLIGEACWLLKEYVQLQPDKISQLFAQWNQKDDELSSYLVEITSEIFKEPGKQGESFLIDRIADITGMKGTGMWTANTANDLLVPIPSLYAAVQSRLISSLKDLRMDLSQKIGETTAPPEVQRQQAVQHIHDALHLSIISCYAQGLTLLGKGSDQFRYDLNLSRIALGWRAGCIIRAPTLLQHISEAYSVEKPVNLMAGSYFSQEIRTHLSALKSTIVSGYRCGVSLPVLASSCTYITQLSCGRLFPASVGALQRDYFGAHTYNRLDQKGNLVVNQNHKKKVYHTHWMNKNREEEEIKK